MGMRGGADESTHRLDLSLLLSELILDLRKLRADHPVESAIQQCGVLSFLLLQGLTNSRVDERHMEG